MPADTTLIHDAVRALSKWPESELPVISAYLDLRPDTPGSDPNTRPGVVLLRDRLREIEQELRAQGHREHSPQVSSLKADSERLMQLVEEAPPEVQAMALFACSGAEQLSTVELAAGVAPSKVTANSVPDIQPLARLATRDVALLVVADTNTLRLFSTGAGRLTEIAGYDEPPDEYGKHIANSGELGGRVDEHRAEFARIASDRIDRAITKQGATRIVLAADEVAYPILTGKLSKKASEMLREVTRLDIRASWDDVSQVVMPIIERLQTEDDHESADRLMDEVGEQDLGLGGVEATRNALTIGQVLELFLADDHPLSDDLVRELVRLALATDARVRFVTGHEGLRKLGGVGALLRFKLESETAAPADAWTAGAGTTSSKG